MDTELNNCFNSDGSTLGAKLRNCTEAILERFTAELELHLPKSKQLALADLRRDIPAALSHIAETVDVKQMDKLSETTTGSADRERIHQTYSLEELLVAYRILRRIVLEEVSAASGARSELDWHDLNVAVDMSLQDGVLRFVSQQIGNIRTTSEVESKYVSFMAHDLRNSLNHVLLVIQLHTISFRNKPELAEAVEDFTRLQRTIFDTINGMSRLLEAERLRRGAVEPSIKALSLREMLCGLVSHFTLEAAGKGLRIRCDVPADAIVNSDRDLITLAMQNLIGNAIKYSSTGEIQVAAEATQTPGSGWRIRVSDQGPGIAAERLATLFELYRRGDTHGQKGMGLGLAIASQAARILGSRLEVQSAEGLGTTFSFWLHAGR